MKWNFTYRNPAIADSELIRCCKLRKENKKKLQPLYEHYQNTVRAKKVAFYNPFYPSAVVYEHRACIEATVYNGLLFISDGISIHLVILVVNSAPDNSPYSAGELESHRDASCNLVDPWDSTVSTQQLTLELTFKSFIYRVKRRI